MSTPEIFARRHSATSTFSTPRNRITRRFVSTYSRLAHCSMAMPTRIRQRAREQLVWHRRDRRRTQAHGDAKRQPDEYDQPEHTRGNQRDKPQRRLDRELNDLVAIQQLDFAATCGPRPAGAWATGGASATTLLTGLVGS